MSFLWFFVTLLYLEEMLQWFFVMDFVFWWERNTKNIKWFFCMRGCLFLYFSLWWLQSQLSQSNTSSQKSEESYINGWMIYMWIGYAISFSFFYFLIWKNIVRIKRSLFFIFLHIRKMKKEKKMLFYIKGIKNCCYSAIWCKFQQLWLNICIRTIWTTC